jgi:hypothetical protein
MMQKNIRNIFLGFLLLASTGDLHADAPKCSWYPDGYPQPQFCGRVDGFCGCISNCSNRGPSMSQCVFECKQDHGC